LLFSNGRCSIDQAIEEIRELLNEVHSVLSKGNSSLSPYSIVSLASIIKDIKKVHTHTRYESTHARTHTHTHARARARAHTHTHTHTYACTRTHAVEFDVN